MKKRAVLALDMGTSSVRAGIFDSTGNLIEDSLVDSPYRVDTSSPGQVSSDANFLSDLVDRTIDQTLARANASGLEISAVGTSCYWHSLIGTAKDGKPTTEVLTWADTRSAEDAEQLRSQGDEQAYHERTGCFFHASYWPAKLRWLSRSRAHDFSRTSRWVSLAEYLYSRFFGEAPVSHSIASGTGLLDPRSGQWDPGSLQLAQVTEEQLPTVSDWTDSLSGLQPSYASRWPVLKDVPWYLGLGDGGLSNVGAGCVKSDAFCVMVGTSGALRVLIPHELRIPWGCFAYRLDMSHWVLGGALSEGGNVIDWLAASFHLDSKTVIESAVSEADADGHGLTVLPFWAGERSPNWRAHVRATIAGLSLGTTPLQIVRAVVEAISYQFATVFETMLASVARPSLLVASGGRLLHSPAWMQMLADVLGMPVMMSPVREASARGAALLALHQLGERAQLWEEGPGEGRTFQPRESSHGRYLEARRRQRELYELLLPDAARQLSSFSDGGR